MKRLLKIPGRLVLPLGLVPSVHAFIVFQDDFDDGNLDGFTQVDNAFQHQFCH
jgi:hypothetical protein